MTDSRIRLYQAITDIDDDIIEEAQGITKKPTTVRFLALAASFCIIIAGAIMLFSQKELPIYPGQNADLQTPSVQEKPPASTTVDYTPSVPDYSAINYSSLALPAAQADPAIMEQFSNYSADILPFDEAFLSDCCGILEGTIKRIYPKHYTYDFYDDKFDNMLKVTSKKHDLVCIKISDPKEQNIPKKGIFNSRRPKLEEIH